MSSLTLNERGSAIHQKIQQLSTAAGTAGLSVGVISNGRRIHVSHYGYQDGTTKEAPNTDTIYHLGSLTKAFTAAGLAILVQEGIFKWDTLLKDVVPGFHQRNEDVEAQATIIDLLAHRMGLAMRMNYWAQMEQELLHPPEKAIDVLGALGQTAEFRSTLKYNNWTYSVAGLIIEHYSGMTLGEFMKRHFFDSLGLQRTTFEKPTNDNYAACHITLSDGTPFEVPRPMIGSGTLMGGAAGLKSSLGDLLTLYTSLLEAVEDQKKTGETSTPGNPFKHTATMFEPHGKKGATEYGLGWFLTELPAEIGWIGINDGRVAKNPIIARGCAATTLAYHNGSMPGALSSVHLLTQDKVAIVVLSNTLSFADVPDYVGGLLLENILGCGQPTDFLTLVNEAKEASIQGPLKTIEKLQAERQPGTLQRPLEAYEGRYINASGLFLIDVKVHNDEGLRMHVQGLPKTYYDLHHYDKDTFAWDCDRDVEAKRAMFPQLSDAFRKVCFRCSEDGAVSSIFWAYARDEPAGETFEKKELDKQGLESYWILTATKGQIQDGKESFAVLKRLKAAHSAIDGIMSVSGTVGASVGVIYRGQVVHTGHFGFRDLSQNLTPNDDTIYPICSLSKSITAASIGILVDEGQFSWDTKIRDILSDFRIEDNNLRENGTLTDILSHRSGLQGSNMWLGSQNNVLFPAEDAMTVINSLKLAHPYQTAWEYSNYGYELAAQMIKRRTGLLWHDVVTERVLKPLDLQRTGFDSDFGNHENVALAYATLDDTTPVLIEGPKLSSHSFLGAGGGVRSSLKDMLEIYRVLLISASDQKRTGKVSTPGSPFKYVQKQFASHVNLPGAIYSETGYGFGLASVQLPGPMGAIGTNPSLSPEMPVVGRGSTSRLALYHQGTLAGAFATVVLFPETDSGIIVLSNSLPLNDSDDWISQLLTEALFDVQEKNDFVECARKSAGSQRGWHDRLTTELRQSYRPGTSPKALKMYVGKYYNVARTLLIHITSEDGELVMNFQDNPQENYSLRHHHDDTFTWLSSRNDLARRGRFTRFGAWFYTINFIEDSNGDIASLNWAHDEAKKDGDDFFRH